MEIPILHLVLGYWWVGDYPLRLRKIKNCWQVSPINPEAARWIKAHRFDNQYFRTRRDVLEALTLALQMPGAIKPSASPVCRRISDGHYQLAGQMKAQRAALDKQKWIVSSAAGRFLGHADSLWRAAWVAEARLGELSGSQNSFDRWLTVSEGMLVERSRC